MDKITEMRMDAYYYGFDKTGCIEVDKILSAVAHAGKAFHHTEQWDENTYAIPYLTGITPVGWIQNAAKEASETIAALRAELAEKERELQEFDQKIENAYETWKEVDAKLALYRRAVGPVKECVAMEESGIVIPSKVMKAFRDCIRILGESEGKEGE